MHSFNIDRSRDHKDLSLLWKSINDFFSSSFTIRDQWWGFEVKHSHTYIRFCEQAHTNQPQIVDAVQYSSKIVLGHDSFLYFLYRFFFALLYMGRRKYAGNGRWSARSLWVRTFKRFLVNWKNGIRKVAREETTIYIHTRLFCAYVGITVLYSRLTKSRHSSTFSPTASIFKRLEICRTIWSGDVSHWIKCHINMMISWNRSKSIPPSLSLYQSALYCSVTIGATITWHKLNAMHGK